jgi:hypothetical protein
MAFKKSNIRRFVLTGIPRAMKIQAQVLSTLAKFL